MTGNNKLRFLLSRIADKLILTPLEQSIQIHPTNDFDGQFPGNELKILLTKLQDEDVLLITREPEEEIKMDYEDECYFIKLLPKFDEYSAKINSEILSKSDRLFSEEVMFNFDKERGILTIRGNDITFKDGGRKIPYLRLLIKSKNYLYHSEAAEELEGAEQMIKPKNTYYEVCRGIAIRLLKYGVMDFLEYDFNRARINPLYKRRLN